MDERQKLQSDLKRYRTLHDLIHDEPANGDYRRNDQGSRRPPAPARERARLNVRGHLASPEPARSLSPKGAGPRQAGLPERRIPQVVQSLDVRSNVSKPGGGGFYHGPPHHYFGGGLGLVAADRRFGPSLPCFLQ